MDPALPRMNPVLGNIRTLEIESMKLGALNT